MRKEKNTILFSMKNQKSGKDKIRMHRGGLQQQMKDDSTKAFLILSNEGVCYGGKVN
jgi:hypothetical protein